jgi:hypothetical protein
VDPSANFHHLATQNTNGERHKTNKDEILSYINSIRSFSTVRTLPP